MSANLPDSSISPYYDTLQTGVYFGYARVLESTTTDDDDDGGAMTNEHDRVHPMVMSIGWNPFYNNDTRTAVRLSPSAKCGSSGREKRKRKTLTLSLLLRPLQEVHILHTYPTDFYGKELRVIMLGFIRPEYNYTSMGALAFSLSLSLSTLIFTYPTHYSQTL